MDIKQMLAQDQARAEDKKAQVRRDFPFCTSFADMVRDAFGPGVKARHFRENGKEIGRPVEACNMDAFRMVDMVDTFARFKAGYKKVDSSKRRR